MFKVTIFVFFFVITEMGGDGKVMIGLGLGSNKNRHTYQTPLIRRRENFEDPHFHLYGSLSPQLAFF